MVKRELNERSPLRILERSIHGGLGAGNLGFIAARKGIGKTACLVHIATDQLFQGKQVIHVSFSQDTRHIIDWYEDIFKEIAGKFDLESAMRVHDELIKQRIIMNFNQQGLHLAKVMKSLQALIRDGHFEANCLIVDGYDFAQSNREELSQVRRFCRQQGLEIWFSVSLGTGKSPYNPEGIPELLVPYLEEIDVLICLQPKGKQIHLQLLKDHEITPDEDLQLLLDPKTMLIARETAVQEDR